jgi:hypothetical protein
VMAAASERNQEGDLPGVGQKVGLSSTPPPTTATSTADGMDTPHRCRRRSMCGRPSQSCAGAA